MNGKHTMDGESARRVDRTVERLQLNRVITKPQYMQMAHNWWRQLMAVNRGEPYGEDRELELLFETLDHMRLLAEMGDPAAAFNFNVANQPDGQTMMLLASSWANYGYRQLCTSHRLAAALMSTRISPDVLEQMVPPWPTFAVEVPRGLLFAQDHDGQAVPITWGIVRQGRFANEEKIGWSHMIQTAGSPTLWGFNHAASLAVSQPNAGAMAGTPFDTMTDMDDRSLTMFWRLVFGLILTMQNKQAVKPSKEAARPYNSRRPGPPTIRTYVIGRPPSVDCRDAVVQYVRGERKGGPLTVQTLVCGHMRNQPYGPRSSLRKPIWIEPFWRGPEDAPILAKPKVVAS